MEDYNVSRDVAFEDLGRSDGNENARFEQDGSKLSMDDFRMDNGVLPSAYGGFTSAGKGPSGRPDRAPVNAPAFMRPYKSQYTGPKGVKRDYERAKKQLQIDNKFKAFRMQRDLVTKATGKTEIVSQEVSDMEQKLRERREQKERAKEESDSDFSDDDAAFEKIKQGRIAAIRASLPTFSTYERINSMPEMALLVKSMNPMTWIVCHLYENDVDACIWLHLCFENLAPQFPYVMFCRMRSKVMSNQYHKNGLPTLLIHKGGKLTHSLICCTQALGQFPDDIKVAQFLDAQGVLKVPDGGIQNMKPKQEKWGE